jgi:hypothetical protein
VVVTIFRRKCAFQQEQMLAAFDASELCFGGQQGGSTSAQWPLF